MISKEKGEYKYLVKKEDLEKRQMIYSFFKPQTKHSVFLLK